MFKITKVCNICAGHQLDLPYESKCNNQHGHNYRVAVTVSARELNACNMVCDFSLIKEAAYKFDHQMIEEVETITGIPFGEFFGNSTTEKIALAIAQWVEVLLDSDEHRGNKKAWVSRLEISETDGNLVAFVCDLKQGEIDEILAD